MQDKIPIGTALITENESHIVAILRTLRPFEKLTITADKDGVPDYYLIHRESKVMLSKEVRPLK